GGRPHHEGGRRARGRAMAVDTRLRPRGGNRPPCHWRGRRDHFKKQKSLGSPPVRWPGVWGPWIPGRPEKCASGVPGPTDVGTERGTTKILRIIKRFQGAPRNGLLIARRLNDTAKARASPGLFLSVTPPAPPPANAASPPR